MGLLAIALLLRSASLCLVALTGLGCALRSNPSFPITSQQAKEQLRWMAEHPVPARRPIVIVGGYGDIGPGVSIAKWKIQPWFSDAKIITALTTSAYDFEQARQDLIDRVNRECPSGDPNQTIEVDVIAQSMGGLVARFAAAPLAGRPRLKVARLFTISAPHGGSRLADRVHVPERKSLDMRTGAPFLDWVNDYDQRRDYELICYTRLHDQSVGATRSHPPGDGTYWLDTIPHLMPHVGAMTDDRILCDIARRLRGETPVTTVPPSPVPPED